MCAALAAVVTIQQVDQASACDANPTPYDVELADPGTSFEVRLVGSEHGSFEISEGTGHPVLPIFDWTDKSKVANYQYASFEDGVFVGTGTNVTDVKPEEMGFHSWQRDLHQLYQTDHSLERRRLMEGAPEYEFDEKLGRRRLVGSVGVLKNLVVLVRFADHTTRCLPPQEDFDTLFNSDVAVAGTAPSGSIKMLYDENSYGQLTVESVVTDWITVSVTEQAASGGDNGFNPPTAELWPALTEALDIAAQTIDIADFDADGDGIIDGITFLHSGQGGENGGTDCWGQAQPNRIWSHKWQFPTHYVDGIAVSKYNISPGLWGLGCDCEIGHIGVIAHEIGHFIGLPDLYDGSGGSGAGSFAIMANSWGHDGTQNNPPPFCAQSKIDLGWVTPTTLSQDGVYTITHGKSDIYSPSNSFGNAYFKVDFGFTSSSECVRIMNRFSFRWLWLFIIIIIIIIIAWTLVPFRVSLTIFFYLNCSSSFTMTYIGCAPIIPVGTCCLRFLKITDTMVPILVRA